MTITTTFVTVLRSSVAAWLSETVLRGRGPGASGFESHRTARIFSKEGTSAGPWMCVYVYQGLTVGWWKEERHSSDTTARKMRRERVGVGSRGKYPGAPPDHRKDDKNKPTVKDIQYGFLVFDSPYISWSTPNFFFELAASDPFLDPERLISGLFYDPDDFVFVEIVHGTTLLLHVHCSHIAQNDAEVIPQEKAQTENPKKDNQGKPPNKRKAKNTESTISNLTDPNNIETNTEETTFKVPNKQPKTYTTQEKTPKNKRVKRSQSAENLHRQPSSTESLTSLPDNTKEGADQQIKRIIMEDPTTLPLTHEIFISFIESTYGNSNPEAELQRFTDDTKVVIQMIMTIHTAINNQSMKNRLTRLRKKLENKNKFTLIQWNCCGLYPRLPRLKRIIDKYRPTCVALQETNLNQNHAPTLAGYTHYYKNRQAEDDKRASGGVAIFVNDSYHSEPISLHTELEAIAKTIIILHEDIVIMNTGDPTHFSTQHGSFSAIDLSFSTPENATTYTWEPLDDLHDSDHYAIKIETHPEQTRTHQTTQQGNFKRANWTEYQNYIDQNCYPILEYTDPETQVQQFTKIMIDAAELNIGYTQQFHRHNPVPWWNDECETTTRASKKALYRYEKHKSQQNLIALKQARAKARITIKKRKQQAWEDYISTLTTNTPTSEMWKTIHKRDTNGKHPRRTISKGVQPNRSTLDSILLLHTEACHALANQQEMLTAFIDIEKAFEKANRLESNCDKQPPRNNTQTSIYADDLIIFCRGSQITTTQKIIQNSLQIIEKWSAETGFRCLAAKTTIMRFSRRRNKEALESLQLYGQPLTQGSPAYGSATRSQLRKLDTIQNTALRLALGAFRTSPALSLHQEANETPLSLRRKQLTHIQKIKALTVRSHPLHTKVTANPYSEEYAANLTTPKPFFHDTQPTTDILKKLFPTPTAPYPPWRIKKLKVNLTILTHTKKPTNPAQTQTQLDTILEAHTHDIVIYTNASKTHEGVGCAFYSPQTATERKFKLFAESSIHTAELYATHQALCYSQTSDLKNIALDIQPKSHKELTLRESVIIKRLRIGHTGLTHKHLLERSNTPTCSRCNTPTTVKHILLDCPNLHHHREKNQIANNMTTILNTEPEHVIQYMRDCEIYHLL
ncbi:hypothetical protein GEV33_002433 [Tenebrio molitor]|uniref:Endonuclease/exonuclease/phosphatase domain-containing protein n=1 Tax=Tenebrio molitor TaxID=7067 RepID=A0A8J6LIN8_TENMO|nr:hypothetical protein GEV33_002433 [Tenebrio molitor]